uniref:SPOC domain-containing protein n=1 Tax=Globodera pallida TaxID=36090 RepID=A0A183CCZ1_GLOPA
MKKKQHQVRTNSNPTTNFEPTTKVQGVEKRRQEKEKELLKQHQRNKLLTNTARLRTSAIQPAAPQAKKPPIIDLTSEESNLAIEVNKTKYTIRQTGANHAYAHQPNWTDGHLSNCNGPTRTSHPGAISNKNNNRLDIYNSGRIEHAFNKDMAPINGKAMVNVNSESRTSNPKRTLCGESSSILRKLHPTECVHAQHRPHDSTKLDDHTIDNCEPVNNSTRPNDSANVDNNLTSSNNTQKSGSIQHNINSTATTNQHVDNHNFKVYNSKPARHDQPHIASLQITFRRRVEKHLSSKCKSNDETTSTTRKEISIALSTGRHRTDDPISKQLRTARGLTTKRTSRDSQQPVIASIQFDGDSHGYIRFAEQTAATEACSAMKNFPLGGDDKCITVDYAKDEKKDDEKRVPTAPRKRPYDGQHHYHHNQQHESAEAKRARQRTPSPSQSPTRVGCFESYFQLRGTVPCTWKGVLMLKKSEYPLSLYRVFGREHLVQDFLRDSDGVALRLSINQRLPVVADLYTKLSEYDRTQLAVMFAMERDRPCEPLVKYLQEKNAAGVISVPGAVLYVLTHTPITEKLVKFFAPRICPLLTPTPNHLMLVLKLTAQPTVNNVHIFDKGKGEVNYPPPIPLFCGVSSKNTPNSAVNI